MAIFGLFARLQEAQFWQQELYVMVILPILFNK